MFGRKKIPAEELDRFEKLRSAPVKLARDSPLMSEVNPRGFRRTLRAMTKIKVLPKGTEIVLDEVCMKRHRAWYRVHKKDSLVSGWMNSIIFQDMELA